jgi:hypothetical protein
MISRVRLACADLPTTPARGFTIFGIDLLLRPLFIGIGPAKISNDDCPCCLPFQATLMRPIPTGIFPFIRS